MKKTLIGLLVVLALVAVGAFGYYKLARRAATETPKTAEKAPIFASIQDAITKSLTLECNFSTDSNTDVLAYVKNGQVRSIVSVKNDPTQSGNAIIKLGDKKIYFWNAQKMGFIFAMPSITVTPGEESKVQSAQAMWNQLEKFKDHCKVANVSDSLFVLPKDVTFQDMTKVSATREPSGSPTGMTQEQVQQLMKQYQPTSGASY